MNQNVIIFLTFAGFRLIYTDMFVLFFPSSLSSSLCKYLFFLRQCIKQLNFPGARNSARHRRQGPGESDRSSSISSYDAPTSAVKGLCGQNRRRLLQGAEGK